MSAAQLSYRARGFAEANRKARLRRPPLGSITWGTRNLGLTLPDGTTTDYNVLTMPMLDDGSGGAPLVPMAIPGLQNPGLNPAGVMQANTLPAKVPVIVTPTSGPIPSPATVAAAAAVHVSWLEQELIAGVQNKWLLLGGIAALFVFGGHK